MLGLGSELMADAAIGGGVLLGLFNYNRGNYTYDSSFRFERFSAAREFAIAQAEMYRGDLRALSALTMKKNTIYSIVASLCMALNVALYCAGRLGLHGPSPPTWIMGLWYTNNAASFSFMALAIWLATHAAFRAQSASVSLLTRKIRVPVPTLKQLDQARRFASEFEQQSWGDIFRVPYINNTGAPKTDEAAQASAPGRKGSSSRSHSAPPARRAGRAASSWVRDEFETDRAGIITPGTSVPNLPVDAAPEHFRLYMQVQKEWYAYDIYARVAILLGLLSFVHSLGYYGLGHINIELRAFWVAHAVGFVLMVLHGLLLRFDIVKPQGKKEMLPYCQWLGPIAWVPAAVGMSLDFRVEFNLTAIAITWVCVFLSYVLQFVYTLRLIEICLPDDWRTAFKAEERIGGTWWPQSWHVPSSFQHVLYLVAPPLKLQPGQHDLYREIKEGKGADVEDAGVRQGPPAGQAPTENVFAQISYVDSLFEWAFQDAVFGRLSTQGKNQIRGLYDGYESAKKKVPTASADSEIARICRECITGINTVITDDGGMQPLSGNDSGYDTAGSAHSPRLVVQEPAALKTDEAYRSGAMLPPFLATQHVQPWRLVVSIVVALAVAWVFLIGALVVDVILGEQALVTAPHWSRPPMTRQSLEPHELGTPIGFPWAAGAKPWIPQQMAWHEEKRRAEMETLGGRRLAVSGLPPMPRAGFSAAVEELMAVLRQGAAVGQAPTPEPVSWPSFFEPQLLACGPAVQGGGSLVAALTSRGFGATAHVGRKVNGDMPAAERFALAGISHLPPLLGASWGTMGAGEGGLTLVSRAGHLLSCPGPRPAAGGAWACKALAGAHSMLPVSEGARLAAATAAWLSGPSGMGGAPRLHAAFIDEAMPELVALFMQDGEGEAASWLPLGEVQVPGGADATKISLSLTGEGDLLLTTARGALLRRRLSDGTVVASAPHAWGVRGLVPTGGWQAACSLQHGPVAHLHLRKEEHSHARRPDLIAAALEDSHKLFFQ
uniref:Uncharacterized protein n=1 Tax=Alexandrium monilatum TaxID=311494 RepID=A0A7S4Q0F1_9DINO